MKEIWPASGAKDMRIAKVTDETWNQLKAYADEVGASIGGTNSRAAVWETARLTHLWELDERQRALRHKSGEFSPEIADMQVQLKAIDAATTVHDLKCQIARMLDHMAKSGFSNGDAEILLEDVRKLRATITNSYNGTSLGFNLSDLEANAQLLVKGDYVS